MNPLLPPAQLDAAAVVRASRSSFVPAFRLLPADGRADLEILYAFCRAADDVADAEGYAASERYAALEAWRSAFRSPDLQRLPGNLRELIGRRGLDRGLFLELLDGTATDLAAPVRMATRADLDLYCHRVAGTVGRLCLPIFGADPVRAGNYADTLGRALQYTNILRDTKADLERGRIYYPLDELATAKVLSFPDDARGYLVVFAQTTEALFEQAERISPLQDAKALRPARIMASIYRALLRKMQRDGLRVTAQRYRLSATEKLWALARGLLGQ
ncbi:MAG: phytoene/squalene synthase family protein [Chthoniobacterales bacterium]